MTYKNGKRTFKTDFKTKNDNGYIKVIDVDTKVELYLPEFVIRDMTYVFSWNRYHEDLDKNKVITVLETELGRLEAYTYTAVNVEIGKKQIAKFIEEL